MANWIRVAFADAKYHCVPSPLLAPLVIEMSERSHPIENFEEKYGADYARSLGGNPAPTTEWAIDFGGCCYVHMPKETFQVDGLALDIWCDHVGMAALSLSGSEVRTFASGERYHKIRHWLHATVLTVGQHAELRDAVEAKKHEAESKAKAFFAEARRKSERVKEADRGN